MHFSSVTILFSFTSAVLGIDNSAVVNLVPATNSTSGAYSSESASGYPIPTTPVYEAAGKKHGVAAAAIPALIAGVILSV